MSREDILNSEYVFDRSTGDWREDVYYPLHEVTVSATNPYILKVGIGIDHNYVVSRVHPEDRYSSHVRLPELGWRAVLMFELDRTEREALRGWHPHEATKQLLARLEA